VSADPTLANLQGLQPDVREAAIYLINAYRAAGYPAVITSGRRSIAHNVSVGGVQNSRHLSGRAVDVGFLGIANSSEQGAALLHAGGLLWEAMGGRWGGRFSTPDPGHFDG
jgi:uncharacterized protein YcbK (DUF882 family)